MGTDNGGAKPKTIVEVREVELEKLGPKADRIMNDERLNFFRTRIRRRILAGVTFVVGLSVFASMSMSFDMAWSYPTYIAIGLYILLVIFGSRVARGFMDLPKELVDERILQRRMESYTYTFYIVMTVLVLLVPLLAFGGVKTYNFAEKIDDPFGGILGFAMFVSMLPITVFLWREPEL